jgi:putative ABC transport system ATP-binding protein
MRPDPHSAAPAGPASAPAPPVVPVLAVTGLARSVSLPDGTRRSLFTGVDLALAAGEVAAITGESGVGKSTLLNIIAGLDAADAGRVLIGGQDLARLGEPDLAALRARHVGFVFQAFHVLPHLDLARNVALPLLLSGTGEAEALARAGAMLDAVGLNGRGADWPAHLSGGELQRVAIARALVGKPALVLADEPTGNLDPDTAARILDLLLGAARDAGAAVVIVTHSERVAAAAHWRFSLSAAGLSAAGLSADGPSPVSPA